ncbi:MAG: ABC transporter ATP-binding protein, partial [Candidatus Methanoperedens sp.]|nr:ABC transporter ATP-binding protein [Candidatus Methanoperedens sp.]
AGKTTTMRMLSGILAHDHGQARLWGFHTLRQARQLREHLGYLPQSFGLYDDLTVSENINFYADLCRVPRDQRRQRIPELLAFANLTPFQDRLAAKLSGGMRQKLSLICTLVHRPRLLLLDEPTSGMDPVSRQEFWFILYELLKTDVTIFLATPDMEEAERAHRVGLMHQGRLLVAESPQALKEAFAGELLELRTPDLRAARRILAGQPYLRQVLAMGDRIILTVDRAKEAVGLIEQALRDAGVTAVQLSETEPGLEDIFVQILGRQEG